MKRGVTGNPAKNHNAASALPTAGYPLGESESHKLGGFLEQCHYCKKKISTNSDIFMYGDLRGFCSIECRDNQIGEEKSMKETRANSKGKK